jgi:hypothetical protein
MNPKTAAKWVEAYEHCQKNRVPAILAAVAAKKYKPALAALLNKKPTVRLRRGLKIKTPQAAKKDLRVELEILCKAIVFTRDCGHPDERMGVCITCKKWAKLQWGHFLKQSKCKWLQYDPRATGGQCAGCNGPGGDGMPLEYAEAIDKRDGPGAAKALRDEAEAHKGWKPNKTNLQMKLNELRRHPLAPKLPEAQQAEGPLKAEQK